MDGRVLYIHFRGNIFIAEPVTPPLLMMRCSAMSIMRSLGCSHLGMVAFS